MAEALGLAASGFAVVSLAIQVAENINKLKAFISRVKDAPSDVLFVIDELETLSLVLEDVDRGMQESIFLDPRIKSVVMRSYRLCKSSGDALNRLVIELETELEKGKKRGGFKVVMKRERTEELQKKLESAKATMLLANSIYYQAFQNQKWESLEQDILELKESHREHQSILENSVMEIRTVVSQSLDASNQSRRIQEDRIRNENPNEDNEIVVSSRQRRTHLAKKATQDGYKMMFGLTDIVKVNQGETTTTSISFGLPSWIYSRRFEMRWNKSCQGWNQSFRTYRIVSYDADVFHLSMEGDVEGLQQLFEKGLASPFEVDPDGRTPLHYAALYARPEACQFLLEMGADANVRTSWRGSFDRDELDYGKGLYYRDDFNNKELFRAWPSYSTPLHLLSSVTDFLLDDGRQGMTNSHFTSEMTIENDLPRTIEILVSKGGCDLFHEDQYRRTIFHAFSGWISHFKWLLGQESIQIAAMSPVETVDLIAVICETNSADSFEIIRQLLPEGKITNVIAKAKAPDGRWVYGCTLLHVAVDEWSFEFTFSNFVSQPLNHGWENLIMELLAAGADPHATNTIEDTALMVILQKNLDLGMRNVKRITTAWLRILSKAGVDLIEYNRVENSMYENGELSWEFENQIETVRGFYNNCKFQLLKFEVSDVSEDSFCLDLVFDDLWATTPLAADFWFWVEEKWDEEDENDGFDAIPGSWQED